MNNSDTTNQRIAKMTFASVYPLYPAKVEKKNRTKDEFHQVIQWLTEYDEKTLQALIEEKVSFETFFLKAKLNPNARLITGVICGYRVEEIENPLTQQVRYLDNWWMNWRKGGRWKRFCELVKAAFEIPLILLSRKKASGSLEYWRPCNETKRD